MVLKVLHDYDIAEKLYCITTDNASNNFVMVKPLSECLREEDIEWDWKTQHIPCLAHIINLVVKNFLDNLEGEEEKDLSFLQTLNKIRIVAKAIRSSSLKWDTFKRCCESYNMNPMTIPLDVVVWWNSTFNMLEQAVYLRRPIRRFIDDCDDEFDAVRLSDEEWELGEVLLLFLMPFKRCTARFECNSNTPEIDYVFFAYDTMYNHIDDVKHALNSGNGIGLLPCARYMLKALNQMEKTLKRYYSETEFPTVYGDSMILNPRCKLSLFEEESWSYEDSNRYRASCRHRFQQYEQSRSKSTSVDDPHHASDDAVDPEFEAMLARRSISRRRNDFDRWIDIPNDTGIKLSLEWWRKNHTSFPDLAKFARDVLAVPASGCKVEREFSISRRIATWQRNRLNASTITNTMMYKSVLEKRERDLMVDDGDGDESMVAENCVVIPQEWKNNWWLTKLKQPIREEALELHRS